MVRAVTVATGLPLAYLQAPDWRCSWATAEFAYLLNLSLPEMLQRLPEEYLQPQVWHEWQCALRQTLDRPIGLSAKSGALYFGAGGSRPAQWIVERDGAEVRGIILAVRPDDDLGAESQAMQRVQESDERMRKYAAATSEALVFFRDGRITDANPAAVRLTGYTLANLLDRPVEQLLAPSQRQAMQEHLYCDMQAPVETRLQHHRGLELDVELVAKCMPENGSYYGMLVLRDISSRKQAQAQVDFLASHDTLTRLPNRQGLMEQMRLALGAAQCNRHKLCLLYVDLDRFKDVNDSLGHDAGDKVLREVARRLRSKVHPDDIVARTGADEFVVVLTTALTASQADCILKDVRFALSKPFVFGASNAVVPASIGVCSYPDDGQSPEELMLNAAAAMQRAKDLGQGHHQVYGNHMALRPSRLLVQDQLLRDAVEKDQGLELHYQPQWDLKAGRLDGFEALVRWRHPERGLLQPGDFIAFAESRGLISLLDRWVIRAACKQMRQWRDMGLPPVCVSVNMSAVEFMQNHLVRELEQILADTGIEPHCLEIELTETTLMQNSTRVQETLFALKALGVGLSIDDFGTGYSSLAYLKRYPLDKIKIDRSFITDTPQNTEDVCLITAIIQMARTLKLRTVAEGVETEEQCQMLRELGCDLLQGYYLAKPMEADAACAWLQQKCHLQVTQ